MTGLTVGQRVDYVHGGHEGVIIEVKAFSNGDPMYLVKRDSDGFVWIGMTATTVPADR